MSLQELESVVRNLPQKDLFAFAKWFEEFFADEWDRQIEADAEGGKLDHLADEAQAEFKAGNCTPL